jgi:hypothetical protein
MERAWLQKPTPPSPLGGFASIGISAEPIGSFIRSGLNDLIENERKILVMGRDTPRIDLDKEIVHDSVMPNEMTPAVKTYEALIRKLKERDVLVAKAVESAHGYRSQNGIQERASNHYGCTKGVLLKTVMPRYRTWVLENKLPQPPEE